MASNYVLQISCHYLQNTDILHKKLAAGTAQHIPGNHEFSSDQSHKLHFLYHQRSIQMDALRPSLAIAGTLQDFDVSCFSCGKHPSDACKDDCPFYTRRRWCPLCDNWTTLQDYFLCSFQLPWLVLK